MLRDFGQFRGGGGRGLLLNYQQFPASGFSWENTGVLISHFANLSRIMLLRTPHLTTWANGVAPHGTCRW